MTAEREVALTLSPVVTPAVGAERRSGYRAVDIGVTFETVKGPLEVLREVSFEVGSGEIVGIVGRSGTGKTTLLRVTVEPGDLVLGKSYEELTNVDH